MHWLADDLLPLCRGGESGHGSHPDWAEVTCEACRRAPCPQCGGKGEYRVAATKLIPFAHTLICRCPAGEPQRDQARCDQAAKEVRQSWFKHESAFYMCEHVSFELLSALEWTRAKTPSPALVIQAGMALGRASSLAAHMDDPYRERARQLVTAVREAVTNHFDDLWTQQIREHTRELLEARIAPRSKKARRPKSPSPGTR